MHPSTPLPSHQPTHLVYAALTRCPATLSTKPLGQDANSGSTLSTTVFALGLFGGKITMLMRPSLPLGSLYLFLFVSVSGCGVNHRPLSTNNAAIIAVDKQYSCRQQALAAALSNTTSCPPGNRDRSACVLA